jgi:hypothetical protein
VGAVLIAAALAGVIAPKLLPLLALPDRRVELDRWTRLLPAATLGALTTLSATQWATGRPAPGWVAFALVLTLAVATAVRRSLPALVLGVVALAALHLAGLV